MRLVIRQQGSRRMGLSVEFPLTDCDGVLVVEERRRMLDRRKPVHDINDLKVILSKMGGN